MGKLNKKGSPFFSCKLRARTFLFILVVIIFIPISMLLIFQGYRNRQLSLAEIKSQAEQLTEIFIDEHKHIIEHSKHLLEVIAQIPFVRDYDVEKCNDFIRTIHKSHPQYSTIVAATGDGVINCCAIPLSTPINVSDRNWFKRVRKTGKFVIDEFLISRSANKASLPFAYPILNDDGSFKMAVGAALDLSYYNLIFNKVVLPADSVVIIIDKNSNILHLSPSDSKGKEQWLGEKLEKVRGFKPPSDTKGSFTVMDSDKVERIYYFEYISFQESNNKVCLFVGFSKKSIFHKADHLLYVNILVLSLTALLSFGFGWYFGEESIVKPIDLLVQKIKKVSSQEESLEDIQIKENLFYPIQELEFLSKNFDELLDKLSQKEFERDEAERALVINQQLYQSMVENQTEIVSRFTPDGTFTFVNETYCRVLNKTKDELLGKKWQPITPISDDLQLIEEKLTKLSLQNPTVTVENRVYTADGEIRWFQFVNSAFFDQQGDILEIQSVGRDITEKKQAEEEIVRLNAQLESRVLERTEQLNRSNKVLEAVNRELESFSYSVSHDLSAPLRGIDGWSLALMEDFEPIIGEDGKKYIERIRQEVYRMKNLIDDLLKLSRLTRSEMVLNCINISEIASKIVSTLNESIYEQYGQQVECIIEPNLTCYGDIGMINIVLTNLISNAFKFTSKISNPKIEFGKLEQNGKEIFYVKDNGAGFDMTYSRKLFTPFQRLHKVSEFPGNGVGLATVQRIIHRHGGKVWAEGKTGEGATFYFTL